MQLGSGRKKLDRVAPSLVPPQADARTPVGRRVPDQPDARPFTRRSEGQVSRRNDDPALGIDRRQREHGEVSDRLDREARRPIARLDHVLPVGEPGDLQPQLQAIRGRRLGADGTGRADGHRLEDDPPLPGEHRFLHHFDLGAGVGQPAGQLGFHLDREGVQD